MAKTCEQCMSCMYEESGNMYCDQHKDFAYVYEEFCPSDAYMWCGGKLFEGR